jgi:hypothetical protein
MRIGRCRTRRPVAWNTAFEQGHPRVDRHAVGLTVDGEREGDAVAGRKRRRSA